jgi:hypothetical protein
MRQKIVFRRGIFNVSAVSFFYTPATLSRTPQWPMADKEGVRVTQAAGLG